MRIGRELRSVWWGNTFNTCSPQMTSESILTSIFLEGPKPEMEVASAAWDGFTAGRVQPVT